MWLWRPFHRTFYQLWRGWNTKSDTVDVFIMFFLSQVSYSKCMYQTFFLMSSYRQQIRSYNKKDGSFILKQWALVDLSVPVGSRSHLVYVIPSVVVFLMYKILPPIILILYPIKTFRSTLLSCNLNFISVFVEKMNSCFRNGLDGSRARHEKIFWALFLSEDGYILSRIVNCHTGS